MKPRRTRPRKPLRLSRSSRYQADCVRDQARDDQRGLTAWIAGGEKLDRVHPDDSAARLEAVEQRIDLVEREPSWERCVRAGRDRGVETVDVDRDEVARRARELSKEPVDTVLVKVHRPNEQIAAGRGSGNLLRPRASN